MRRARRKPNKTGRNTGDSRHVRLHHWVLDTAAYCDLKPIARALLVQLYRLYNGANNGELFLSVRDAATAINVAPNTALKAFADLETHGFIRAAQRGSFSLKSRHATTWILTEFPYRDALPTKCFARWVPHENQKAVSICNAGDVKICDRRYSTQVA